MLISYRWLGRHVDLDGKSPEDVARDLTLHVCEIEGVERFAPHLSDVVVGYVVERTQHPDADKLSVCQVDPGDGEPLTIVCGAPNVDAGQKIALAKVGTRLPGDFKIKKSKIRGVPSMGMICSERELELGDDHDGIWVLPDESQVGAPVAAAVGADDWVLEVDNKAITHRPDLWGHRGIARELAALWGRELKPLDTSLPEVGSAEPCPVRVETENCSRYVALPIEGVSVTKSPDWMRLLLLAAGQRPLDLLVDVSNFVMLDLGQPNHLFDRRRISLEGIVVRQAHAGEVLQTLDGEDRKLREDDMLICSGAEPVAIAGVMGGEASKVEEGTTSLLLEVAAFQPVAVRRTSMRIGLRTDASARFEKFLTPTLPLEAAGHLVRLLAEIQPNLTLPAPLTDAGEWSDPACSIALRPERVRNLLGVDTSDDDVAAILTRLGFSIERGSDGVFQVGVPSWRATKDVTIEEDLIEEVGRIVGYDVIAEQPILAEVRPVTPDRRRDLVRRAQDRLAGSARFHEALTYSFASDELLQKLNGADAPHLSVTNAVAEGMAKLRRSVVPSLLALVSQNLRRREDVRLFEVAKGTWPEERDERGKPREVHEVGLVWAAPAPAERARFDADRLSALKGVAEDLLRALDAPPIAWTAMSKPPGWAHPARALEARATGAEGEPPLAVLAALEPGAARELEIRADVAAGWVSLDALVALPETLAAFEPLPRFPGIKIDVALAVPSELPAGEVAEAIRRSGKSLVAAIELFDLYEGEQVGTGRKSLAYHVVLQAAEKTLTDKDGQKFLGRLEREIERLGGELRKE